MKNIFGATDTGLVRTSNQDTFRIEKLSDSLAFAVLCDGMGGEKGGSIASSMAAEHACTALCRELTGEPSELTIRSILMSAVSGANALVFAAAEKDKALAGMGTTMILAVFFRSTLYIACVGDSRVYCVSPQRQIQVTHDHTVVQMLVDLGEITPEDAKTHPKRHFITRAVGVGNSVDADFIVQELEPDDVVLICSDGLYGYLQSGALYDILKLCLDKNNAEPLIDLAKAGGGADNITAIVCGA